MEALLLFFIIASLVGYIVYQERQYQKTSYYQITKNAYSNIKHDKGKFGEYLMYKGLQQFENVGGKFLFNIYVPKWNNETTEIDMLLICSKGLFVFESKNYSGWIFGNENNRYWMQTFPIGRGKSRKERFYNPVMQNEAHIKHLRRVVGDNIPMYSIVVFSDSCTLKDITTSKVRVINCCKLASVVNEIYNQAFDFLTPIEINNLYEQLYPFTQIDDGVKEQHINKFANQK